MALPLAFPPPPSDGHAVSFALVLPALPVVGFIRVHAELAG